MYTPKFMIPLKLVRLFLLFWYFLALQFMQARPPQKAELVELIGR